MTSWKRSYSKRFMTLDMIAATLLAGSGFAAVHFTSLRHALAASASLIYVVLAITSILLILLSIGTLAALFASFTERRHVRVRAFKHQALLRRLFRALVRWLTALALCSLTALLFEMPVLFHLLTTVVSVGAATRLAESVWVFSQALDLWIENTLKERDTWIEERLQEKFERERRPKH